MLAGNILRKFMMFKRIQDLLDSIMARDPAARSRIEVLLCYSGVHAVLIHRLAHGLWQQGFRIPARFVSLIGRWLTGIEIHPGAFIGRRLFIDHGMGVVIGETAVIGDDVTLYHDVTLGGTSPSINARAQVDRKRHPTLADGVIVGSGAQILGPITIGRGARVGANAVVVKDVPASVTVIGIPARIVEAKARQAQPDFVAYGTPSADMPDPLVATVETLRAQIAVLRDEMSSLARRVREAESNGTPPVERIVAAGSEADEGVAARTEGAKS